MNVILISLLRHVLTGLGLSAVAVDENALTEFVRGINPNVALVLIVAGFGWSIWDKRRRAAVASSPTTPNGRPRPTLKILGATLLAAGLCAGCRSTPGPVEQQSLDRAAVILKTAVSDSVILGLSKDTNAVIYVRAVGSVLDTLIAEAHFKPRQIGSAVHDLPIKELNPEARIAINTLLGLYEVYWGDYVRGQVAGDRNALVLLTAIRDGIHLGLGGAGP
jgi:hypothetical protein